MTHDVPALQKVTIATPPVEDIELDWSGEVSDDGKWQQSPPREPLCQWDDYNNNRRSNPALSVSVFQVAVAEPFDKPKPSGPQYHQ